MIVYVLGFDLLGPNTAPTRKITRETGLNVH